MPQSDWYYLKVIAYLKSRLHNVSYLVRGPHIFVHYQADDYLVVSLQILSFVD